MKVKIFGIGGKNLTNKQLTGKSIREGNKEKYMTINRNFGLKNKQCLHRNEFTLFLQ
jgi:hypothetical protein